VLQLGAVSSMRFLVTPNTDEYMDRNSLWGLVRALRAAGHEALFPTRAIDGFEISPICRQLRIDVLFQLNRGRPYDLPKTIRHVAWFQDQPSIPLDVADRVQSSDLVYRVVPRKDYDPDVKGRCFEGYLLLAMDETMIDAYVPPTQKSVDFSFCGTMLPPLNYPASPAALPRAGWKRAILSLYLRYLASPFAKTKVGIALGKIAREASGGRLPSPETLVSARLSRLLTAPILRAIVNVAELNNDPLTGDWNPDFLVQKMREIVSPQLPALSPDLTTALDTVYAAYALEVPRLIERFILVENMLHITDSVELYGVNWNLHPMLAPYHKGIVTGPQALFGVYGRSRVNGTTTLRSILHRRTLECMGIGEFIFLNASVSDNDPGGMRTYFEPGVHYGEYRPNNVQEEALRWIRDDDRRRKVGQCAGAAVREKHLWRHRAEQIVADLRKM